MLNKEYPISGIAILQIFPTFIQNSLIKDAAFCDQIGLEIDGTVSFDGGRHKFRQSSFFTAIRELYKNSHLIAEVSDTENNKLKLVGEKINDRLVIALELGETKYILPNFSALDSDDQQRIREFNFALSDAGLHLNSMPDWRQIIEVRPLVDEEITHWNAALMRTPISWIRMFEQQLSRSEVEFDALAPPYPEYYEHLCGTGNAISIEDLATTVVPELVSNSIAWSDLGAARMGLLLASHSSIIPNSGLNKCAPDTIKNLAIWARQEGDLISKIGMIELGLEMLPEIPELSATIQEIVEQILELNANGENGRLQLFVSLFIFIYGELSRTKVLAHWPPFRRRFAALAQAALCERHCWGRVDQVKFSACLINERSHHFFWQSLVDLRLEPRWRPEYIAAEQFRNELIGRIYNATNRYINNISDGPLKAVLVGPGCRLNSCLSFPGSWLPGPLEGEESSDTAQMPDDFAKILDQSLETSRLEARSVIALINLHGLFPISDEKVERAITLIREARHRFDAQVNSETRDSLIAGLAGVASVTRNPMLADEVRTMIRRYKVDGLNSLNTREELITALVAGAAHNELDSWRRFVGDWCKELAFSIESKEDAQTLSDEFGALCIIEPALRLELGRALAAVQSYLES